MANIATPKATRSVAVVPRVKPQRGQAPGLAKMVAPHPKHLVVSMTSPVSSLGPSLLSRLCVFRNKTEKFSAFVGAAVAVNEPAEILSDVG